jgi:hypothetical protein
MKPKQILRGVSSLRVAARAASRAEATIPTRRESLVYAPDEAGPSLSSSHAPLMHGRQIPLKHSGTSHRGMTQPHILTRLIKSCGAPAELLTLLQHHSTSLNEIHLSASMVMLAKHQGRDDKALAVCILLLASVIRKQVASWDSKNSSRAVANIIWAAAKLIERLEQGSESSKALGDLTELSSLLLLRHLPLSIPHFNAQHVSNCAYALSIISRHISSREAVSSRIPFLLGLFLNRASELFLGQEFNEPQAYANLLYSLSSMSHVLLPESSWVDQFLDSCEPLLDRFEPMHISSTLTALSNLSYHPGESWLRSAMKALRIKLRISSSQSLSNILWSLAKLGCQEEISAGGIFLEILNELLEEVSSRSSLFSVQDCSNTLWSLAKLNLHSHPRSFDIQRSLISHMARPHILTQAVPQDISNALWAISSLSPMLRPSQGTDEMKKDLEAIASHLTQSSDAARGPLMAQCKAQELSNIALAAARCGLTDEEVWLGLWDASLSLLPPSLPSAMQPQHIVNMTWAAARSGQMPSDAWFSMALEALIHWQQEGLLTDQAKACVLWSSARMGVFPSVPVLHSLLDSLSLENLTDQGLAMVFWAVSTMNGGGKKKKRRSSPSSLLLSSSFAQIAAAIMDRVDLVDSRAFLISLKVMAQADAPLNLSHEQQRKLVKAANKALPDMRMTDARSILKSLMRMGLQPGPR